MRGDLSPACSASAYLDRQLIGVPHMYKQPPPYRRDHLCSTRAPRLGPLPDNAPAWCTAPFEPEGVLSSTGAILSCMLGAHFAHVLITSKDHKERLQLWLPTYGLLMLAGYILQLEVHIDALGIPLNKLLYRLSYTLLTGGVAGLILSFLHVWVDLLGIVTPTRLFEWMGKNPLFLFIFAVNGVFEMLLHSVNAFKAYIISPIEATLGLSSSWHVAVIVITEIVLWSLASGVLHIFGIYLRF
eukprot:SM000009S23453  [mRNA]  locus=s9:60201:62071:- [translate_table: standard]